MRTSVSPGQWSRINQAHPEKFNSRAELENVLKQRCWWCTAPSVTQTSTEKIQKWHVSLCWVVSAELKVLSANFDQWLLFLRWVGKLGFTVMPAGCSGAQRTSHSGWLYLKGQRWLRGSRGRSKDRMETWLTWARNWVILKINLLKSLLGWLSAFAWCRLQLTSKNRARAFMSEERSDPD